jgi:hypothetical protein
MSIVGSTALNGHGRGVTRKRRSILSVNADRRDMTKGTKAMARAIAHPEPTKSGPGRGNKRINSLNPLSSSETVLLSQARTVIKEFGVDSEQVA